MTAPMTPERLAEIRDWLQGRMESGRFMPIGEDMARELLAEVDRLRARDDNRAFTAGDEVQ